MARLPEDPARAASRYARTDISKVIVRATDHAISRREEVLKEIDFPKERVRIRNLRLNATGKLDCLIERFSQKLQKVGFNVLFASTGEEAKNLIIDVAKRHNCHRVVKSKSMTTEEIHLREHLEGAGLEVWETDLGELIVQLKGEPPSHLTAPAVHLTASQIAELFDREGISHATRPQEIASDVRTWMRMKFFSADLGIIGVNAAAAREGALLVMSNEGNIRMVATLPRVLVVLVGIDKLVEGIEDLAPLVRVVPKNATGQRITNYVQTITRPRPGQRAYVVLLDNGRSSVPEYLKEALLCVRCAACMNVCPVYRTVGGHAYGSVYVGPMGIIVTNALRLYEDAHKMATLCTLCGACRQVCAAGIDIPGLILRIRASSPAGLWERIRAGLVRFIYSSRRVFKWSFGLLRALSWLSMPYRVLWRLLGWRGRRGVPRIHREDFDGLYNRRQLDKDIH